MPLRHDDTPSIFNVIIEVFLYYFINIKIVLPQNTWRDILGVGNISRYPNIPVQFFGDRISRYNFKIPVFNLPALKPKTKRGDVCFY